MRLRPHRELFKSRIGQRFYRPIGTLAVAPISWLIYGEGWVWTVLALGIPTALILVLALVILQRGGLLPERFAGKTSPVEFLTVTALLALVVFPFVLVVLSPFVSVLAVWFQAALDLPWRRMSLQSVTLSALVVIGGAVWQYSAMIRLEQAHERYGPLTKEDGAEILQVMLAWPLLLAAITLASGLLGWTLHPFTLGVLIGSFFGFLFLRMFLVIGALKAITLWHSPALTTTCGGLRLISPVWDERGLTGLLADLGRLLLAILHAVLDQPELMAAIFGYLQPDNWLDTAWYGTINLASLTVTLLALLGCAAPGG